MPRVRYPELKGGAGEEGNAVTQRPCTIWLIPKQDCATFWSTGPELGHDSQLRAHAWEPVMEKRKECEDGENQRTKTELSVQQVPNKAEHEFSYAS